MSRAPGAPFLGFFEYLRARGLPVTIPEWLALMEALSLGLDRANLGTFYHLARALLIKREQDFDRYDQAFASYFHDVDAHFDLSDELLDWLANPPLPPLEGPLDDAAREALAAFDAAALREGLLERLREQTEQHDGGSRWIGTGGTSPYGHGGRNAAGVRIGGPGGGRSAVLVAEDRRFRNLRSDRVLDTRQLGVALRRLRRLQRHGQPEVLDLDATIDHSARQGEIDLIFGPERANRVKLLLLLDVGGSMDPHAALCERLFSAAHAASHFRAFESRYFHNCVYGTVYTDMAQRVGEPTIELLRRIDTTWTVIVVGDAWMSPYELTHIGSARDWRQSSAMTGLDWLRRLRAVCPDSAWLNPEPRRIWRAPSVQIVRTVFPMYELTLDGLAEAIDVLAGRRPNRAALDADAVLGGAA
ncbi:MAG: VWA domain-containing protein [Acidobacteriota bacterium]